ncbi:MAG: ABC transporter permease subunit [Duodenibacillus sp.]|nr:ABC transporter permease subunit [Duodenibacillus sp.]
MDAAGLAFPLLLTLKACAAAVAGFLALAVPLAFWLARSGGLAARAAAAAVTLPLVFPPIAMGYLLMLALGKNGPVGGWLWDAFAFRVLFSQWGVFLAGFAAGLPLVVRPLQVAFGSERLRELEAASLVCGADRLATFFSVTLPLTRNAILAGLLLGAARAAGEVGMTLMLGGNVAGRTNTLSLEIYNCVSRGDFDEATGLCLVLLALALALYLLLELIQSKKVF